MVKRRTWDEFAEYAQSLQRTQKTGRQALRREWTALRTLFEREVRPHFTAEEINRLLGKRFDELDPEENDLKALIAHAVGRGLFPPERLREALRADNQSSPLSFLAGLSGKAFGEVVAPAVCRFWLAGDSDMWDKRPGTDFYDVAWTPTEIGKPLRLEVKASSEAPAYRFQQVRRPRTGSSGTFAYDALLCLGVTARSLEFCLVPAPVVESLISDGTFEGQHGGKKVGLESNTYWFTMTPEMRRVLKDHAVTQEDLRDLAKALIGQVGT